MNKIDVREATKKDATSIALLHALSWKTAYRNILSDEYLDSNLEEERKSYWVRKLENLTPNDFVLIAETVEQRIIGFIAVLDKPERGYQAFIDNLHVHPDHKGSGIGKTLMR